MSDILRNHALAHVWAEPLQDSQHKIKPSRISPRLGFFREAQVMWERVPLPNFRDELDTRSFHVYPLGQLPPHRFALNIQPRQWYRADALVDENNTVIDLYADNGAIVPRDHYYLYLNYDNNLLLAVARNTVYLGDIEKKTPYGEVLHSKYSLDDHGVTIRFYNNAVTHTNSWQDAAADSTDVLKDHRARILKPADFTKFMEAVAEIQAHYKGQGKGVFYQDGFIISEPVGYRDDFLESELSYQYDETIKDIRQFDIDKIPGFRSIIDTRKDKYLLVSPTNYGILEFHDDCDFYLVARDKNDSYRGVRLDVYADRIVRQVTHNAWSVSQDAVVYVAQKHQFLDNLHNLTILVVVRQGGMKRGIGFQNNRVEELYRLPYDEIVQCMAGTMAAVPEWRAENLENSAYIKVMSSLERNITKEMVEDAYGYNAATTAVAKSMYPVINGKVTFDDGMCIPWNSRAVGTNSQAETLRSLFWYDENGKLLGYTTNTSTAKTISIPTTYATAKKVEVIMGKLIIGVGETGTHVDKDKMIDATYGYFGHRNYVCNLVGSGPDNKWVDVTDDSVYCNYIVPENGDAPYIEWNYSLLAASNLVPATRFANIVNVHSPSFTTGSFTGVYVYDIMRIADARLNTLQVPPGHVDVFMNGSPLIHGLDYYYGGAGSLIIVRKPSTTPDQTRIVVRFYGYANPKTNQPFLPRDVGFVQNGLLSVNNRFNLWHDRDVRVIVDGSLKSTSEVMFAEPQSPSGPKHFDGKPYAVEDYQALVEPFTSKNTISYMMEAMDIDERVSNFLTPQLPGHVSEDNYVTPHRYELYSPIMGTFIQLILRGALTDYRIDLESTDQAILRDYGHVAAAFGPYDPVIQGYDENFVYVHPHAFTTTVQVTSKQYAFLERVNRVFLRGALDLTNSVTIKLGT